MTANSTVVDTIVKKILILSANPKNTSKLRLDSEVREVQAGLERALVRSHLEIISRWKAWGNNLRCALLDHEPQIVDFSGHGTQSDGLALTNHSGDSQLASTQSLVRAVGYRAAIEFAVGFYDAIGVGRSVGVGNG